jgi:hypothetical protein
MARTKSLLGTLPGVVEKLPHVGKGEGAASGVQQDDAWAVVQRALVLRGYSAAV